MSTPTQLAYVQTTEPGVHDPAHEGLPRLETRRERFTAEDGYMLTLGDAGVVAVLHRESGRCTLVPFSQCRFAVVQVP